MKIGICDWGIGGLGFFQMLDKERPDLDVVYIGDQGVTPYGRLSRPQLTARLRQILASFRGAGVDRVIVACNAASTVIEEAQLGGQKTTGVIEPTLRALEDMEGSVGVIGGERTIRSGSYGDPLRERGVDVRQKSAQPLSRLIEDGDIEEATRLLPGILKPLKNPDILVLACTHYTVLEPQIQALLPKSRILDPATETWKALKWELPKKKEGNGQRDFHTTGDPDAMQKQAKNAFNVKCNPQHLPL